MLFGGGDLSHWIESIVQAFVDDGRIGNGLSNSGDRVILRDAAGDTVDVVDPGIWPSDRGSVRIDEMCHHACDWSPHDEIDAAGRRFSPGVSLWWEMDGGETSVSTTTVRITEIFPAPPASEAGDANRDGTTSSYEDEFIEIHNAGSDDADLSGWQLSDDDTPASRRFTFPVGTVLPPSTYAVLFGGGSPDLQLADEGDLVFVDDGRISNGLTNGGDRVLLISDGGDTVAAISFEMPSHTEQSLLVVAEANPHPHWDLPGRTAFSPGEARPLFDGFIVDTLRVTLGGPALSPVLRGQVANTEQLIDIDAVR